MCYLTELLEHSLKYLSIWIKFLLQNSGHYELFSLFLEHYELTQILQMHSDLVHPAGLRSAQHDASVCLFIVAQSLEYGRAVLAFRRHFADTDLVAHHLDWL